jgi:hypothetical protein
LTSDVIEQASFLVEQDLVALPVAVAVALKVILPVDDSVHETPSERLPELSATAAGDAGAAMCPMLAEDAVAKAGIAAMAIAAPTAPRFMTTEILMHLPPVWWVVVLHPATARRRR